MAAAGVVAVFFESACGLCRGPDKITVREG